MVKRVKPTTMAPRVRGGVQTDFRGRVGAGLGQEGETAIHVGVPRDGSNRGGSGAGNGGTGREEGGGSLRLGRRGSGLCISSTFGSVYGL